MSLASSTLLIQPLQMLNIRFSLKENGASDIDLF